MKQHLRLLQPTADDATGWKTEKSSHFYAGVDQKDTYSGAQPDSYPMSTGVLPRG